MRALELRELTPLVAVVRVLVLAVAADIVATAVFPLVLGVLGFLQAAVAAVVPTVAAQVKAALLLDSTTRVVTAVAV
jgi:hypothetical protein